MEENTNNDFESYQKHINKLNKENEKHRLKAKEYEIKLKKMLNLSEDAEVEDWESVIKGHQVKQQKNTEDIIKKAKDEALSVSNQRLINAEIKSLGKEYNVKLLDKVIDKSKLSIDETGQIIGLNEELELTLKEFPEIKLTNNTVIPSANTINNNTGEDDFAYMKNL